MSETEKRKDCYYQVIPRLDEPTWKQDVLGLQTNDTITNGQLIKGQSRWVPFSEGLGQYVVKANSPWYVEFNAAMALKMQAENHTGQLPRIVGPFDTSDDALKELHRLRPRTPGEQLELAKADHAAEKSALQQKIADLEAKLKK